MPPISAILRDDPPKDLAGTPKTGDGRSIFQSTLTGGEAGTKDMRVSPPEPSGTKPSTSPAHGAPPPTQTIPSSWLSPSPILPTQPQVNTAPGHPIGPVTEPLPPGVSIGKPGQIPSPTASSANAILDNSSYSTGNNLNIWNGVTGIDPGNNETGMKQELNRPIAAAQELSANWHKWGLDKDISFSNPPATLPPEAQAVIKYVAANPALTTELGYAGQTGKSGDITKAHVDAFIKQATSDAGDASKKVQDWMKKNPGASDQAKSLVQSAAVVMANQALATSSDTGHQNGTTGNDGLMTASGLSQLGAQNPGLSQTLGDAAKLWGQPGMFKDLDTAGEDPAFNAPDGKVNTKNLGDWITDQAPTNDVDFANLLNQASVENTVAGIDTSKIGKDVFTDPSKYTGAQKAAVMVQLGDLSSKIQASVNDGIYNSGQNAGNLYDSGISSNPQAVQSDINQKIQQLQQDPDVQAYLGQTLPGAQQAIMNSDGRVQTASQNFFNTSIKTGDALNDDLKQTDSKGNPVTPSVALQSFTQQTTFYDGALGSGGKTMGLLDPSNNGGPSQLNDFVKASGQEGSLQSYYINNIENTKLLTDAIGGGTEIATATSQFTTAAATFATALDPTFISNNAQQTQNNFVDNTTGSVLNSATSAQLATMFGDQNQTSSIVQQLQKSDPSLFTASDGTQIAPDKILSFIRQTTDLVRQGVKVTDAMSKVGFSMPTPPGAVTQAYQSGLLHVVSAVLAGGVAAAKGSEGSPSDTAGAVAAAAQAFGAFTEGSGKFGGVTAKQNYPAGSKSTALKNSLDTWKNVENFGKAIGGFGSAMSGALSVISGIGELKSGDKVAGGLNIGTGTFGAAAGVAGATESGAGLASTAGLVTSDVAESVAAVSSVLGVVGTAVGSLGGLGYLIDQVVKGAQQTNSFDHQTVPTLAQYGIDGGFETSDGGVGDDAPTAPSKQSPPPSQPASDHGQGSLAQPPTS